MDFTYTKVLNVQDIKQGEPGDAGYDLFLPEFDDKFFAVLLERNANTKLNRGKKSVTLTDNKGKVIAEFTDTKVMINEKMCLPVGLQFNIPKGIYGEICNRSSNHALNLNVTVGYIDNIYTFNCGFQVSKIEKTHQLILEANTRIAQLILKKYEKPEAKKLEFEEFENLQTVKDKRNRRTGGFGSTGNK